VLTTDTGDAAITGGSVLAFVGAARELLGVGRGARGRINLWNVHAAELSGRFSLEHQAPIAIALTPDGERVALGTADHAIHVVDTRRGIEFGALDAIAAERFADATARDRVRGADPVER
jgi:hypothetical protein